MKLNYCFENLKICNEGVSTVLTYCVTYRNVAISDLLNQVCLR